jgi:hypothetical protein
MTNQQLLNLRPALQIAASGAPDDHPLSYDGAQTTAMRYALLQNQRRLQDALEGYQEMLQELISDHDVDLDGGQIPEDAPEEFRQELQELLQQEAPFDAYTISDEEIKAEPSVPLELLSTLGFMVEE